MLVLSRKPGETIYIGEDISITIVRIGPNTVRVGIEAPRHINIHRDELPPPVVIVDSPIADEEPTLIPVIDQLPEPFESHVDRFIEECRSSRSLKPVA